MHTLAKTSLIALFCLLTACGWQLRGTTPIPESLARLELDASGVNNRFAEVLKTNLEAAGVKLSENTPNTLVFENFQRQLRNVSVDRSARSAQRELSLTVAVRLLSSDGRVLFGPDTISAARIFRHDPDNVVAKVNEERLIETELRESLARQILSWYRAAGGSLDAAAKVSEDTEDEN